MHGTSEREKIGIALMIIMNVICFVDWSLDTELINANGYKPR